MILTNGLSFGQQLIKKSEKKGFDFNLEKPIYTSNAGYCKIYKVTDSIFVLHNGYSDLSRKTIVSRTVIDEIIKASKMILEAEKGDQVFLESIKMSILKTKLVGDLYKFRIINSSKTLDFSNLTPAEIESLSRTSNVETVMTNGQKTTELINVIESEVEEDFMHLSKPQLKKLIQLTY